MKNSVHARPGVTLLETLLMILIVELFVIGAVLVAFAFAVLPKIVGSAPSQANLAVPEREVVDPKVGMAKFNLHTIRSQIELYKSQHDGRVPSSGLEELLTATNADGTSTPPANYGPYLHKIPANPFNNRNVVVDTTGNPPTAIVAGDVGYLYHPETGKVWINDTTIPFVDQ